VGVRLIHQYTPPAIKTIPAARMASRVESSGVMRDSRTLEDYHSALDHEHNLHNLATGVSAGNVRNGWRNRWSGRYLCRMASPQPLVPSVIVLHGALGSAEQMRPVTEVLQAQRQYASVLNMELPGHGHTVLPERVPFSMRAFAMALQECIHRESLARPVVLGYSMGGYVALLLEHLAPGTIGGIVTLGTMLHWTPAIAQQAAARLNSEVIRAKVPAYADQLAARHAHAGGWELLLERTAGLLRELGDEPLLTRETLSAVHCPVHLLVGGRDDSVSLEEATTAASYLPRARASLLPDMPHPIEKVDLAVVAREVSDLTAQLTAGV
jgi:pimeloyl-ACP methyl ester carboxylesterase